MYCKNTLTCPFSPLAAEESDDSGHAGEDVVRTVMSTISLLMKSVAAVHTHICVCFLQAHKDLEAERQQVQREIEELERKLGADAALVDALTGKHVHSCDITTMRNKKIKTRAVRDAI